MVTDPCKPYFILRQVTGKLGTVAEVQPEGDVLVYFADLDVHFIMNPTVLELVMPLECDSHAQDCGASHGATPFGILIFFFNEYLSVRDRVGFYKCYQLTAKASGRSALPGFDLVLDVEIFSLCVVSIYKSNFEYPVQFQAVLSYKI